MNCWINRMLNRCTILGVALCLPIALAAQPNHPDLIPVARTLTSTIPDTSKLVAAWKDSILSEMPVEALARQAKKDVATLKREIAVVEQSLGFPLDAATLASIVTKLDYVQFNSYDSRDALIIADIGDTEKFNKLVDLGEKAAAYALSDPDTTSTVSTALQTSVVVHSMVGETSVTAIMNGNVPLVYYCWLENNLFALSIKEARLQNTIKVHTKQASHSPISSSENYQKATGSLAAVNGEISVHAESGFVRDLLQAKVKTINDPMLAVQTDHAVKLNVEPTRIALHWNTLIADTVSSHHPILKYPPSNLEIGNYIPPESLGGMVWNQNDYLFFMKQAMPNSTNEVTVVDNMLGFSLENDLLKYLGNEMAFAVIDYKKDSPMLDIGAVLVYQINNQNAIDKLITKLRAKSKDIPQASGLQWETETVGDVTLHSAPFTGTGYSPTYALTEKVLMIGSTKESVKKSLMSNSTGIGISGSQTINADGFVLPMPSNALAFIDMKTVGADLMSQLSAERQESAAELPGILERLSGIRFSMRVQGGIGESILVLDVSK